MPEIVDFLERSSLLEEAYTQQMCQGFLAGKTLADVFGELGFSQDVVTQISLADQHGNLSQSLSTIQSYLTNLMQIKKKLIEVATYPLILLSFLIVIMLGLKHYLIPNMTEQGLLIQFINHFPSLFLVFVACLFLFSIGIYQLSKTVNPLTFWTRVASIPLVSHFVQLYLTAFYAREWGNLISQGLEMTQIVALMQDQPSRLFVEIGRDMEQALMSGQEFHTKVASYPFFLKELGLIIEYGQVKSKLGSELAVYAEETWEAFFTKVQRASQLIQPLIFILVALMIVMVYAAMLLPMYQNMEVHL